MSLVAMDTLDAPFSLQLVLLITIFTLSIHTCSFFFDLVRRSLVFSAARKQYGCQSPLHYPHKDVFGIDLYRKRRQAASDGRTVQHYDEIFEALGRTWQERLMGKTIINTVNPKNIQHILATGISDFRKIGQKTSYKTLLGSGIFLSNGHKWKVSRDLVKPLFAKPVVSDLSAFGKHAEQFMMLLPRDGRTVDVQPLIKKLFLDSSTEFIFGESMMSMQCPGRHPIADDLVADLSCAIQGINNRILAWSHLQHFRDRAFPEAVERIHHFIDQHVQAALALTSPEHLASTTKKPPGRFVLLHEMARQIRDPVQLRYEILNIFMASRDTISTLVSNCLFQLARHPEVWHELRVTALSLGKQPELTFDQLKSLQAFRFVVNETFRTIGPTGKATRIAIRDTVLPTGGGQSGSQPVFVPRGTFVVVPNNSLHHDREIWGKDAQEFRPDRWKERTVKPWEFIPFIGGPRICPAQQMVTVQAVYLLVLLVREFESIENRDPMHDYIEEAQLLLTESRNGVQIGLMLPSSSNI